MQNLSLSFLSEGKRRKVFKEVVVVVVVVVVIRGPQNRVLATPQPFWAVATVAEAGQNSDPLAQSGLVWLSLRLQLLSSEKGKGNSWCRF